MNVFVYGSLMHDGVATVVLGKAPKRTKATIQGFHRYKIKGCVFPGIMLSEDKDEVVDGWVYSGVSQPEMDRMDAFEDEEYERELLPVTLSTGEKIQAHTYVWKLQDVVHGTWSYNEFLEGVDEYMDMCRNFAQEYEAELAQLADLQQQDEQ